MNVEEIKTAARNQHDKRVKESVPRVIKDLWLEKRDEDVLPGNRFRIESVWRDNTGHTVADVETNADLSTGEVRPTLVAHEQLW
jgi:hypothetical protein